jgi:hypothetical protein
MRYKVRSTGTIASATGLKQCFPNTSFPREGLTDAILEHLGVDKILPSDRPVVSAYQSVEVGTPVQNSDGDWVENWVVRDMFSDTFDADGNSVTREQQEADYQQKLDEEKAANNRLERNHRLTETDWWAVADRTMTSEETAYRQALRDITSHANWPHLDEADWPTKP